MVANEPSRPLRSQLHTHLEPRFYPSYTALWTPDRSCGLAMQIHTNHLLLIRRFDSVAWVCLGCAGQLSLMFTRISKHKKVVYYFAVFVNRKPLQELAAFHF